MKREGEENVLASMSLELSSEHRLSKREGVTDVQMSVGIRIREGYYELGFRIAYNIVSCCGDDDGVGLEGSLLLP